MSVVINHNEIIDESSVSSRVVECAQGALLGRILGAQWALRGRSSAQRPRFSGRFAGRSEYLLS